MISEKILDVIKTNKAKTEDELANSLNIKKKDREDFNRLLDNLKRQGLIFENKKGKILEVDNEKYFFGKVQTSKRGFGFLITKNLDQDIYISENNLNFALNGDDVVVKKLKEAEGEKPEGEVVYITERVNEKIVGTFQDMRNFGFVVPDENKFSMDIYIPKKRINGARNGQKVLVKIDKWPEEGRKPEGRILEVLGFPDEPHVDVLSVAKAFDLPMEFSKTVKREAKKIQKEVSDEEMLGRLDLRNEITFTIDGKDSKDFDDAVSLDILDNGNYLLGVHIADVSHYVKEDSAIDEEAFKRGNSVYLLNKVIPMLPFELSNGICSLNEGVDRLTLSCIMEINKKGDLVNHKIVQSVINSKRRLVYDYVSNFLEEGISDDSILGLEEILTNMYELSKILQEKRKRIGSIDFDIPEPVIKVSEDGWPLEILKIERRSANKLIEDFMLMANTTVAEYFAKIELPFIYRIHEKPREEKIDELNSYIRPLGYIANYGSVIKPKDLQKLLEKIQGKKEELFVSTLVLRAMTKARYSAENKIHFGLSFPYYTHFTSPIRRYADLSIHRIIKDFLRGDLSKKKIKNLREILPQIADHVSETEKLAQETERQVDSIKMAEFMSDRIGNSYEGIVSGITNFGIFVQLDNLIEGLVPYKTMDGFFEFDSINFKAIDVDRKISYGIGDRVKVEVTGINLTIGKIDFKLIGDENEKENRVE
ncbi:ribonuclease R [Peptoniphilus raoultii]|uniref:ribonuclease R n=1 Tax=Peptoniphilus raoultii TaxID=1776387 RepID=UPI0008DAFB47|nr:ribonuclease R [Peptoniphilus raoultii]